MNCGERAFIGTVSQTKNLSAPTPDLYPFDSVRENLFTSVTGKIKSDSDDHPYLVNKSRTCRNPLGTYYKVLNTK